MTSMEFHVTVKSVGEADYPVLFAWLHPLLRSEGIVSYGCSSGELQMEGRIEVNEDPAEVARSLVRTGLHPELSFDALKNGKLGFNGDSLSLQSASHEWINEQIAAWKKAGGDPERFLFQGSLRIPEPGEGWPAIFPALQWVLSNSEDPASGGTFEVRWYDVAGLSKVLTLAISGPAKACATCRGEHVGALCEVLTAQVAPDGVSSLEYREGPRLARISYGTKMLHLDGFDFEGMTASLQRWENLGGGKT